LERAEFERMVREALEELPEEFHRLLGGLQVVVEDYPDDELMEEWGAVPPDYPFGLYEGLALPDSDAHDEFEGRLVLYQRPLETWSRDQGELRDQIRRTVYHELGHRFGFPEGTMPDELRGGVGGRWTHDALWREARRYLIQAEHDLAAAQAMDQAQARDWTLTAAVVAADRALQGALLACGVEPEVFAQDGLGELLARLTHYDQDWRKLRGLIRLHRITMDMGAAGLPGPAERVRLRAVRQALHLAEAAVQKARREVNG